MCYVDQNEDLAGCFTRCWNGSCFFLKCYRSRRKEVLQGIPVIHKAENPCFMWKGNIERLIKSFCSP